MTDHLEPFRQLARTIRFAPPLGQHERFNKLVHQPSPVPSAHINSTAEVARPSLVAPDRGPSPDPSERAAAVVHAAVSKATVLPVTNHYQENISDRIDRLGVSKQARLPIVMPKIPAPDPNWIPPAPPPVSQTLVTPTPTAIETAPITTTCEVKSDVPQPETPVDSDRISTPVVEPEEVVSETTESIDVEVISPPIAATEEVVTEVTEPVDLSPVPTPSEATEEVVTEVTEPVDLSLVSPPNEVTEVIDRAASNANVEADLKDRESVTQNNETIEVVADISPTENLAIASEVENATQLSESVVNDERKPTTAEPENLTQTQIKPSSKGKLKVICPECGSSEVRKNGRQKSKQKYLCKDCGRQFVGSDSLEEKVKSKSKPIEEPKANEIALPSEPISEPIEEPKVSEIALPSEPIEEPKASEIALPSEPISEPIEEAKVSEIALPSEPISEETVESKASETSVPSEPISEPIAEPKVSEKSLSSQSKKEPKASEKLLPSKSKASKTNSKQAKGFGRSKKK